MTGNCSMVRSLAAGFALSLWSAAAPSRAADAGADVRMVASEPLPNLPGNSVSAVLVSYAPGGRSPAHHHAGSVLAYVLTGRGPLGELGDRTGARLSRRREFLRAARQ